MTNRLPEIRGGKPLAQYMEARLGWRAESASADFHELRQGFIPPNPIERDRRLGENHA